MQGAQQVGTLRMIYSLLRSEVGVCVRPQKVCYNKFRENNEFDNIMVDTLIFLLTHLIFLKDLSLTPCLSLASARST